MENVQKTYTEFHKVKHTVHMYPTEWVIRTLLGKYPNLELDKSKYKGAKLLDLGFGDCRNMLLLNNCHFDIYGVEISEDIISLAFEKLKNINATATLKKGSNADIPFEDAFFDYLLACHSCYYVDKDTSFSDNLKEMARVIKPGGTLLASLPAPGNFILKDCIVLQDGHVQITNDPYQLRNGYIFRTFESEDDVRKTFSPFFANIQVCECQENYWGVQINYFLVAGDRK